MQLTSPNLSVTSTNGSKQGNENVKAQLNTTRKLNVYPNMNGAAVAIYWHASCDTFRNLVQVVKCIATVNFKLESGGNCSRK